MTYVKYMILFIGISLLSLSTRLDPIGDYWEPSVFFGGLLSAVGLVWVFVGDDEMKRVSTNDD